MILTNPAPVGGTGVRGPSHVGFFDTDDEPQMPVPPDLSKTDFKSVMDVQTAALPKSQIAVVVSSYDKTIGKLNVRMVFSSK